MRISFSTGVAPDFGEAPAIVKTIFPNGLRWLAIAVCAVAFVFILVTGAPGTMADFNQHWIGNSVALFALLLLAAVPLTIAVMIYRRSYRELTMFVAFLVALVLFFTLASLPRLLGLRSTHDLTLNRDPADIKSNLVLGGMALLNLILTVAIPFWVSRRFYLYLVRFATSWLPHQESKVVLMKVA